HLVPHVLDRFVADPHGARDEGVEPSAFVRKLADGIEHRLTLAHIDDVTVRTAALRPDFSHGGRHARAVAIAYADCGAAPGQQPCRCLPTAAAAASSTCSATRAALVMWPTEALRAAAPSRRRIAFMISAISRSLAAVRPGCDNEVPRRTMARACSCRSITPSVSLPAPWTRQL